MHFTTVEELLIDEGFLAWYHRTDEKEIARWDEWMEASAGNRKLAGEAIRWLMDLESIDDSPAAGFSPRDVDAMWRRIDRRIEENPLPTAWNPRSQKVKHPLMLTNYIKVAGRHLRKNRVYSSINILGLSMGLAVALLIGLWVWDELSYNQYHSNYKSLAQVLQYNHANGRVYVQGSQPIILEEALRRSYGNKFSHIAMFSPGNHNISFEDKKFFQNGNFMGAEAPEMLSLAMEKGTRGGLKERHSILLSTKLAESMFGHTNPMGKTVMIDNRVPVKVTGVYETLPVSSDFSNAAFILPWDLFTAEWSWVRDGVNNWDFNVFRVLVQLGPHQTMEQVSREISNLKNEANPGAKEKYGELFLFPMSRWHLYDNFTEDGTNTGGQLKYVRLFGAIGIFVLLLACINFMNLSTARSEKRAREVGIRKAVGSVRTQLIFQFLSESTVVSMLAFGIAMLLVQLTLPLFNQLSGKDISILWDNPWFWTVGIGFSIITGVVAGSYPAFYLSSFRPVKVLKGEFKAGRFAAYPRRVLVVVQFTVSVLLAGGTVIVFQQIQYAKNRPVGFDRKGLLSIPMTTGDIYKNYNVARNELLASGMIKEVSESQGPLTDNWVGTDNVVWTGSDPKVKHGFAEVGGTIGYGRAIGWNIVAGRDFSTQYASDSNAIIVNEAAAKIFGVKDPIGMTVRMNEHNFKVLGIVKDIIMTSPYGSVPPTIFYVLSEPGNFVNVKIAPNVSEAAAMQKIQAVFERYNPAAPFIYTFAYEDFAKKFGDEERIGRLAAVFATLAILISCLGLFGLSAFLAEQRTKEIGIRKVLGATVFILWRMLSREFVLLVVVSCAIAIPLTWHFLDKWLQQFDYRIKISGALFAAVGMGALMLALATVSYQAVRAALANPVKSLRSE